MEIPASLRRWFVAHFIVDWLVGVPLFLAPVATLRLLGWTAVDPVTTRLVAAALLAIGAQSYLGRHEELPTFRALLNLKLIWSSAAILALLIGTGSGAPPPPGRSWPSSSSSSASGRTTGSASSNGAAPTAAA